ncbi:WXG100 family type VII secretion target [Nocardia alni]|uniref:WXG100 family type VII secretion target n=1 Tax=Nocardia alni TaxID=2815723 RepID=UPI001C23A17A|nr:WXG100 family type VII secretion target [Nocardia alni]
MTDEYGVDLEHLDQVVAHLRNLTGFLTDTFDEIDRRIHTLREGSWEGAAAQAYTQAHTQWITGAREFTRGVTDATHAARDAHGHYTHAVDINGTMLNG